MSLPRQGMVGIKAAAGGDVLLSGFALYNRFKRRLYTWGLKKNADSLELAVQVIDLLREVRAMGSKAGTA